jgi:hypothetical protein
VSTPYLTPAGRELHDQLTRRGGGSAEVIDPAAHDRLDALTARVDALEAGREDAGEDEQESA